MWLEGSSRGGKGEYARRGIVELNYYHDIPTTRALCNAIYVIQSEPAEAYNALSLVIHIQLLYT
jgi:hypothetical protein